MAKCSGGRKKKGEAPALEARAPTPGAAAVETEPLPAELMPPPPPPPPAATLPPAAKGFQCRACGCCDFRVYSVAKASGKILRVRICRHCQKEIKTIEHERLDNLTRDQRLGPGFY
jgi:hypothetical protein